MHNGDPSRRRHRRLFRAFNCGMDHFNFGEKIAFYRIRLRNVATRDRAAKTESAVLRLCV